ncbi:MAG TPA: HNH endonuclease [Herpetosiphonaceae bacterium]
MDSVPQKSCITCKELKPLSDFPTRRDSPDGYRNQCHVCRKLARYNTTPGFLGPGDTKTCALCKKVKPVDQFWTSKVQRSGFTTRCKECGQAAARDWKRRNKDKIRAYEQANREYLLKLRRDWVERNRSRYLALRRKAAKTPYWKAYNRNKQALRRTLSRQGDVTPEKLQALLDSQHRCYYCHKPFTSRRKKTIDHVIPIVKGGEHVLSNLVVACQSCNSIKHDKIQTLL